MAGLRRPLKILGAVCAFYVVSLSLDAAFRRWSRVRLEASPREARHFDLVEFRLRTRDRALRARWRAAPPRAVVFRGARPISGAAGVHTVPLAWDPARGLFAGRWPCPWNAPDGRYRVTLGGEEGLGARLREGTFLIGRRPTAPAPPRFSVMTWESFEPLETLKVRGPDGKVGGWQGLLDWVQFAGADGFWMLAGATPGKKDGEIWDSTNLAAIPAVAAECRRRGLVFGVYVMCYLTTSKSQKVPGYEYALELEDGELAPTRAISLRDPKRPGDVAALLKRLRDIPGVSWLGLDYIRDPLGGYELVDDFFAQMPGLRPPEEWPRLSRNQRILWFARKKILRRDRDFIDAWQWWRAHTVSKIIRRIKAELGEATPLWAFTLTWQRGWHHGQDAVMFRDAGIDLDALMLYEATSEQFEWMVDDWRAYVRKDDVPLMVGDIVDFGLHQRSPRGPGELSYRLGRAASGIHSDGAPAGLFIHDLQRALHGRLGPYTTRQWMEASRRAIRDFKGRP